MQKNLQVIQHRPYGNEHPYQQQANERFPRKPMAGEPVLLGVETLNSIAITQVWGSYTINHSPTPLKVEAVLTSADEEHHTWQVALPAFDADDTVAYTLFASDGDHVYHTETYQFTPLQRKAHSNQVTYSLDADQIVIHFPQTDHLPAVNYRIEFHSSDYLDFSLEMTGQIKKTNTKKFNYQIIQEDQSSIILETQSVQVEVHTNPFLLKVSNKSGALILAQDEVPAWLMESNNPQAVQLTFQSMESEGFYGFGERYNAFNQRGNRLDIRVYEEYKNQGVRTYFPIPFFLSSHSYGFYLDTSREAYFDLGASKPDVWNCDVTLNGESSLSFKVFTNPKPAENLKAFSALVGLPALPPDWVYGLWMSSNEWNSQAEVMKQIQLTQDHQIPAKVVVIEAWSDESTFYIWNDAKYHPKPGQDAFTYQDFSFEKNGLWPNPKEMIDEIHRLGMKIILWQIPVMKKLEESHAQHDADQATMLEKGYCVLHDDGSPYLVRTPWFTNGLLLDATNPTAVDWWLRKRAYLLDDLEIDGFKTDGGEHLWAKDVKFADGSSGHEGINAYPNQYVGAYYRFANQKRNQSAVTFSRAGFTGAQTFPCHWAGDENSTWAAFRSNLLAGLSVGLSGVPFWGWDIAGFSGPIPSAELYIRSAAMAAFCPIMQYHSEFNQHRTPSVDRTPWNIAEQTQTPQVITIFRKYVNVRQELLPYIQEEARYCASTGEPFMRPLFLDWPDDAEAWKIEDQYCFGRSYLVAPVLEEGANMRRIYLPAGNWEDFWTHEIIEGNKWITRAVPWEIIPVYRLIQ
jgi:alpha-glucosidase (family GH31 glycosyl hydrolase)